MDEASTPLIQRLQQISNMKKLTDKEMREILEGGTERRDLEFKSPFSWTDDSKGGIWIREHVIRGTLAMSNLPLGGRIIIGIKEKTVDGEKIREFTGVTSEQLRSFSDDDVIRGEIDGFASSSTNFEIAHGEFEENTYVVLTVQEFDEIPIQCRKNGQTDTLEAWDLYVRSKRAPYGSKKATDVEMREMVRMAVRKEKDALKAIGFVPVSQATKKVYDEQVEDLTK